MAKGAEATEGLEAERRAQIIEAAARVISERGFARARLVDVADEAGVSIGLLQHYFRTRDRLLTETFAARNDEWIGAVNELASRERDPLHRLLVLLRFNCSDSPRPLDEDLALWLEFWLGAIREPALKEQSVSIDEAWHDPFRRAIQDGVADGTFRTDRPVDDIVNQVVALIDGLGLRELLRHPGMTPERMYRLLVAFVADVLHVEVGEEDLVLGSPLELRPISREGSR